MINYFRSEMFFTIGAPKTFCNIHRKKPVLESLFQKIASPVTLLKRDSTVGLFW